jgi:putative ABC transport system permease protein
VEQPVQLRGQKVSAHFFDIFGVKAALGRTFVDGEDQAGQDHVAVISDPLWKSQFGADPAVIGRTILLDGEPHTVVGVLPKGSAFDRGYFQIWRPLAFPRANMTRDFHWLGAFGRLKPGVSLGQARTQMGSVAISIAHDFPDSNKGWGVVLAPLTESYVSGELTQSLYVLMAAVGMVLLIGCANLANLTLARSVTREREVAIRAALGAGRWRLVRQFLTESLLLSLGGGVLGMAIAYCGIAALKAVVPPYTLPMEANVGMDAGVLLFTLALSVVTGVVFGLVPALKASRPDLANSMKEGGQGASPGHSRHRLRNTLVIAEVALASALLSGAGLLIRSFFQMQRVDTGFDATNVITADLPISNERFPAPEQFSAYLRQIMERVSALPGVRDVALTSALPMQGWGYGMPFQIVGSKVVDVANRPDCFVKMVSPSYFRTIGMKLKKGRFLGDHDVKGAPPVAVMNQSMAKKFFADKDPLGMQISIQEIVYAKTQLGPYIPWEVVGIVADEKIGGLSGKNEDNPGIYVTEEQCPQTGQALVVRGSTDPSALQRSITNAVHEVDRNQVLENVKTLERIKTESMGGERLRSSLLAIFAATALLLAAIGLYGVIAYSVGQRTREIGIRTALGATSRDIQGLVLRNGMALTGIGLVIGVAAALALSQFLSSMLFNVEKYDPVTMGAVAGILVLMALLACYLPARRATRVSPITALRYE